MQLLRILVWFITAPEKLVNLLAEWQVSHDKLVGKWLLGLDTGVTPANTCPLWQVSQPLRMPLWFIAVFAKFVNWLAE
jgi:hypothetical protein